MPAVSRKNKTEKLSMKEEDYLEAIQNSILDKGYARCKDVAESLDVSPSSVTEMFSKLSKKDLVIYRRYEGVTLTESGKFIANQIIDRHDTLVSFLKILGVPDKIAEKDGCFMEHELDKITIDKIKQFVKSSNKNKY